MSCLNLIPELIFILLVSFRATSLEDQGILSLLYLTLSNTE